MTADPRRSRRSHVPVLLAMCLPLVAFVLARRASNGLEGWLEAPFGASAAFPVTFDVPRGAVAGEVARQLADVGVVGNARAFRLYLQLSGAAHRIKAGEYAAERPMSPVDLAGILVSGRVVLHPFTVPEGLDIDETARALASAGWWSESDLGAVFRDPSLVVGFDPAASDLEGYLFPETYNFPRGASAKDVASAMVARFREVWRQVDGDARAAQLGLTVRNVLTLASLVQTETPLAQETRLVSSVYHNRLRRGMRLECDPTVIYALKRDGVWTGGPLLIGQLSHASPYNTYVTPGLPPGPICSPGQGALDAALDPAATELLYFVATGTGGHYFAATLAEHQRNVTRYRQFEAAARALAPGSTGR